MGRMQPIAAVLRLQPPSLPCSLRYGHVLDGATLRALLTGQLEGQALRADSDDDDAGQR